MRTRVTTVLALILATLTFGQNRKAAPMVEPELNAAANRILDDYMAKWNSRNTAAWETTFHFPHFRLAGGRMTVLEKPGMQSPDLWKRMADGGWDHSKWDRRKIIQATPEKIHVDTRFTRYRADGTIIGSYDSLYILTFENGRWGVKMRSSFAQ